MESRYFFIRYKYFRYFEGQFSASGSTCEDSDVIDLKTRHYRLDIAHDDCISKIKERLGRNEYLITIDFKPL